MRVKGPIVGVLCALVMGVTICAGASKARAQFVVSDPSNLVQNMISVFQQMQTVMEQVRNVRQNIQQVKAIKRDLEQLSAGDLRGLQTSFYQLESLYQRARHISMEWEQIGRQYDAVYSDYDPAQHDKQTYYDKRKEWEEQTEDAIRTAMMTHGVVTGYEEREATIEELVNASDSAEGTLAAIQAGNRISALLVQQMMEMSQLMAADSRARLSYLKEQQMKAQETRQRRNDSMMRGWGDKDSDRPQVDDELPEIR